jgi:hypothetical protein
MHTAAALAAAVTVLGAPNTAADLTAAAATPEPAAAATAAPAAQGGGVNGVKSEAKDAEAAEHSETAAAASSSSNSDSYSLLQYHLEGLSLSAQQLYGNRQWDDKGTGCISCKYVEGIGTTAFAVVSEADGRELLMVSKRCLHNHYCSMIQ